MKPISLGLDIIELVVNGYVKTTDSAGAMWHAEFTVSSGWHHFALTWNQSTTTAKMYVDGIIVAQETSAPASFSLCIYCSYWLVVR